ncbi:hypothetical protein O6H91_Y380400 [Diphasiastrum complanatum]|nr:hypothetical protein O6H91_Y380400 [Diphasiastrum complanatum]
MSSDSETGKSGGAVPCRPVLQKTQPKVPPKLPMKPLLKASINPKSHSKQSVELATTTPESSVDLSPKIAPKKLKALISPVAAKTPPGTPKSSPGPLSLSSTKKTPKCATKSAITPPSTPVPSSPGSLAAAMKSSKQEFHAQRRLRISGYGRKPGSPKCGRIMPEGMTMADFAPPVVEKKRCGWITTQSDPAYIAYHDEEWGVPVYDQIMLFELLVLVGAQAELSWPTILSKREHFRAAFSGFDPAVVSNFNEKKILSLASDSNLSQPEAKIRGAVNNAKKILEVACEFGSFSSYLWSFVNHKPTANKYRLPKQVPVKSPKSEAISKDLVKRGFRFVGPTVVYSLMQAAGMINDHLVQCFRHEECLCLPDKSTGRGEKGEAQAVILARRDEVVVC